MARAKRRRSFGAGGLRPPRGAGGTWGIRWRVGAKRCYRGGFATRELAERVLARVAGELAMGRAGVAPAPDSFPTLAAEAEGWHARRDKTHRWSHDARLVWNKHLAPFFGHLRPAEVDAACLRRYVEAKLAEGYNPSTVRQHVLLLSTFFADLCERPRETGVQANPVRSLPRSTRRLLRPTWDPRLTPFIERLDDVRRVFQALRGGDPERGVPGHEAVSVAFAVGALAGLRPGEVLGLDWRDVDLDRRLLTVRQQVQDSRLGPLKDDEARLVPVQDALAPILAAWRLKSGGTGQVVPTLREKGGGRHPTREGLPGAVPAFMRPHTLHKYLDAAFAACGVPRVTWYQATRHTFASLWVAGGGSIEKLAAVLGHSATWVTERYAHLRPGLFGPEDRARLAVDLTTGSAGVVPLQLGHHLGSTTGSTPAAHPAFS